MSMLVDLAIKYGARILLVIVIVISIFAWDTHRLHEAAEKQHETDMEDLKRRNNEEQEKANLLLAKVRAENDEIKLKHQETYIGVLNHANQVIQTTTTERNLAITELRNFKRRAKAENGGRNAQTGEADISKDGAGGNGNTCSEVSTEEIETRLEISRLAGLCLISAKFIRENSDVR